MLQVLLLAFLRDEQNAQAGGNGVYQAASPAQVREFLGNFYNFQILKDRLFVLKTAMAAGYEGLVQEFRQLMAPQELEKSPLFRDITYEEYRRMLPCFQAVGRSYQAEELIYIDSGNGEFTGQVVCGVRKNGRTVFKPVGKVYPEMLKDDDKFPSELSCAEASLSDPQSITANITAATAVVNMVYNILTHGENRVRQTNFSTKTVRMQTILEKQNHRRMVA